MTAPRRSPPTGNVRLLRERIKAGWTAPVARLVGFRLTQVDRGRTRVEMRAGARHTNPMGTLHGGILCDIADAAMGIAYVSLLGPGESFTTIELKINFLRPVWTGGLVATGRIVRKGRTMGLLDCRITDERRRLVAYATSTCLTLAAPPGDGLVRRPAPRARRAG